MQARELGGALIVLGGGAYLLVGLGALFQVLAFHYGLGASSTLSSSAPSFLQIDTVDLVGSIAVAAAGFALVFFGRSAVARPEGGSKTTAVIVGLVGGVAPAAAYSLTLGLAVMTYNEGFFSGVDTANNLLSSSGSSLAIPFGLILVGAILIAAVEKPPEEPQPSQS